MNYVILTLAIVWIASAIWALYMWHLGFGKMEQPLFFRFLVACFAILLGPMAAIAWTLCYRFDKPMSTERGKSRRDKEINSSAYKKHRRELQRCPICPPNKGENAKRHAKHGETKPRRKDKR
jgi:hypothetical protein